MKHVIIIVILLIIWFIFFQTALELPEMGNLNNPTNQHIVKRYLHQGEEESGAKNAVTNIILNYRGYDTMGEVTVIFTALWAILAVLMREEIGHFFSKVDRAPVNPSIIVRTVVIFMVPLILIFGFYLIFHGEDTPGGGFQGGAVIGAGFIIYTLTYSILNSTKKVSISFRISLESSAILTFLLVGSASLLMGLNFLNFNYSIFPLSQITLWRRLLMLLIEVGIGLAGGSIITSIFFSMERIKKDEY